MDAALDLGSRTVKVVMASDESVLRWELFDTAQFYRRFAGRRGEGLDLGEIGIAPDARVGTTGYGRYLVRATAVIVVPEIRAHVLGVGWRMGRRSFVMVDIGGQDVKVAHVKDGRIGGFLTNDKCAAGTGRYLENAARALGLEIDRSIPVLDHGHPGPLRRRLLARSEAVLVTEKDAMGWAADRPPGIDTVVLRQRIDGTDELWRRVTDELGRTP